MDRVKKSAERVDEVMMRVILVGVGERGAGYLHALRDQSEGLDAQLVGVVQPRQDASVELMQQLQQAKIPLASSLSEAFQEMGMQADAVVLASPLQHHFEQCYEALSHGCHVLCEKPLASDYVQALTLEKLSMEKGLQLAVAYQHCYSKALRSLKQDVLQGRYGKPISMRALSLTGRSDLYYQRNRWAGRFYDEEGRCIMDGVLHNEASHSLQSLLYLLGDDGLDSAADVETVRGEWCRAHAIQSYDTAVVSVRTAQCPSVLMAATHNWAGRDTHRYRYVWEHGYAEGDWSQDPRLIVHSEDGIIDYGDCACPPREELQIFLDCLRNGQPVPCSVHSAKAEVAVCTGMYLSAGWIRTLPEHELQLVRGAAHTPDEGGVFPTSPRLSALLELCYQKGKLPFDLGGFLGGESKAVTMEAILCGIEG